MRDARVEEVEHLSDSDSEERDTETPDLTVGIFPTNQGPTYLLCPGKQVRTTKQRKIFYYLSIFIIYLGKRFLAVPSNGSQWRRPEYRHAI